MRSLEKEAVKEAIKDKLTDDQIEYWIFGLVNGMASISQLTKLLIV